jgi:hypothetical protein
MYSTMIGLRLKIRDVRLQRVRRASTLYLEQPAGDEGFKYLWMVQEGLKGTVIL